MILECDLTNEIISSALSISEKIGRLKEIQRSNLHIYFKEQNLLKNIQVTLENKEISFSVDQVNEFIEYRLASLPNIETNKIQRNEHFSL